MFDVRGKDKRTYTEQLLAEGDPGYMLKTHFGQYNNSILPAVEGHDRTTSDTLAVDQYNFNNANTICQVHFLYGVIVSFRCFPNNHKT